MKGLRHHTIYNILEEGFINLKFEAEPSKVVISSVPTLLPCLYNFSAKPFTSKSPEIQIEWIKDGVPLSQSQTLFDSYFCKLLFIFTFRYSVENGSLLINEALPIVEGYYQCSVHFYFQDESNENTKLTLISRRAFIQLPTLNRFEYQPLNHGAFVGTSVAFRCILVAYFLPLYGLIQAIFIGFKSARSNRMVSQ